MLIETYFAHEVESGDNIHIGDDNTVIVTDKNDDGDLIVFTVTDEDGEASPLSFAPFDPVPVVVKFDTDEVLDVDVPID
jgi:hypothetical protein